MKVCKQVKLKGIIVCFGCLVRMMDVVNMAQTKSEGLVCIVSVFRFYKKHYFQILRELYS